ncbi:putative DNA-binding protein [Vallitalea okinawensis]|uniref:putative DNA-binding protein n=1 Tax=Vallitalea okinawensis TaxID=2078660 RepID=UPI000CFE2441|nr:putative DNA-binding protein [Vallitalea okinawensis]
MDKILEVTLLYDFYGELLTVKQKKICELYFLDDLSLSEVSEHLNISRQGVHDALKRSEKQLHHYEEKLKLVHRFVKQKKNVENIIDIVDSLKDNRNNGRAVLEKLEAIQALANDVLENY